MKKLLLLVVLSIFIQYGFAQEKKLIGFSQCTMVDEWRETMVKQMNIELSIRPDIDMVMRDAAGNSQKQIEDIYELIKMDIDLLIVSPNESEPLTAIVSEVYNSGIPVIIVDRKINSDNYSVHIGADNYLVGMEAANHVVRLLNGKGRIFEISGLQGSSPAQERHNGFADVISKYPEIKIINSASGDWLWQKGKSIMLRQMEKDSDIDLVFAHNDFMARGAYLAAEERNRQNDFYIVGIDGLLGDNNGVQNVLDGKQNATVLYPTGGYQAIEIASKILNEEEYPKELELSTILIDSTNARIFKLQNQSIMDLQQKIQTARGILEAQIEKYNSQQTLLTLALVLLVLVGVLIILLFRSYRMIIKVNNDLLNKKVETEKQNQEIKIQQRKLIEVNKELEFATQMKLKFFTNISHEFRTPLTLIIGPLENLIEDQSFAVKDQKRFRLMHRNAMRMLRLINQLMDFRKSESGKLKMRAENADINSFIHEVKSSFEEYARIKKYDFYFNEMPHPIWVYFDRDKMDKIMFNILSNAFKYTPPEGRISITLIEEDYVFDGVEQQGVQIEVKDSGRGMSKEHIHNIFERFYQIDKQKEDKIFPGTGIGLALTKSLVTLHKGVIEVESEKDKGTVVRIFLRKSKDHFKEEELIKEHTHKDHPTYLIPEEELQYTPDLNLHTKTSSVKNKMDDKPRILVVEDNPDVRMYIESSLGDNYHILEAENGVGGLEMVQKENPDLIISDIMMPIMDGMEMTKRLKSDVKTCHIPIILLTALASMDKKIEGIEYGADSYIPKPFNSRHLEVRTRKLIENSQRIRSFYRENIDFVPHEGDVSLMDKRFIEHIRDLLDKHLAESEMSVEFISGELGMSRVHLYRKLKHLTGMTATEFIKSYRLKKAVQILLESGKSISEVAYETGFSTPSYFTKCFKEHFKVSPSKYIQNQKK